MDNTIQQFDSIIAGCRDLFVNKTKDYGTAWRILRPSSITDQLYIKALRLRSIEEKGAQQVDDPISGEYVGLINYSVLAMIQLNLSPDAPMELGVDEVAALYDQLIAENRRLLSAKNHDYGEAWRHLRISSITDLILQKLLRIKQIEDNGGQTVASEGLEANYRDIINYAVFAMIRLAPTVPADHRSATQWPIGDRPKKSEYADRWVLTALFSPIEPLNHPAFLLGLSC